MTFQSPYNKLPSRQMGAALLLITAVLGFGSAAGILAIHGLNGAALARSESVARELQKAKQALIAYAVNYADNYASGGAGPGHLPCPDPHDTGVADNGSPAGVCGQYKIGRLPVSWLTSTGKATELYPFARAFPRRFWYVSAEDFRYSSNQIVNPDTAAALRVDDIYEVVAVIIDPGPPLTGQTRPSDKAVDYLEGSNADGDANFITGAKGEFNDRLVYITRSELLPLVEKRVLGYVADWLRKYRRLNGDYPTPAALGNAGNHCDDPSLEAGFLPFGEPLGECADAPFIQAARWFQRNRWEHFIYYHRHRSTTPDELIVNGVERDVLIVSVGRAIETIPKGSVQNRATAVGELLEYLDSAESVDTTDNRYVFAEPIDRFNNDQFIAWE